MSKPVSMASQPLITIIVPCHNEAAGLPELHQVLAAALATLPYQFEILMIDDGSTDETVAIAHRLARHDLRIQVIELSRNFGKEVAITAGLHRAQGEAAIMIDADLQHPPRLIAQFLAAWQEGAEVVVGVRARSNRHAGWLKRTTSHLFYRFINLIAEQVVTPGATDFRLLDRMVIDEFNRFTERNRMTRGLIDWLGFRRAEITFMPGQRHAGRASYGWNKLFTLAMHSVISLSLFPLKLAGYLGVIITSISLPLGIFMYVEKYLLDDPWKMNFTGTAQLAVLLVFMVGMVLASLGLMSLYIGAIHAEVTNRPLYVLRRARRLESHRREPSA